MTPTPCPPGNVSETLHYAVSVMMAVAARCRQQGDPVAAAELRRAYTELLLLLTPPAAAAANPDRRAA